jgi:hypothetical protein
MTLESAGWTGGTPADNDREEARSARDRPLREHWSHPLDCRCRECFADEVTAGDWR